MKKNIKRIRLRILLIGLIIIAAASSMIYIYLENYIKIPRNEVSSTIHKSTTSNQQDISASKQSNDKNESEESNTTVSASNVDNKETEGVTAESNKDIESKGNNTSAANPVINNNEAEENNTAKTEGSSEVTTANTTDTSKVVDTGKTTEGSKANETQIAEAQKSNTSTSNTAVGKMDYKTIFKDSVFVGDSITEGLSYYQFLNDDNVNAKIGLSLYKAKTYLDKVNKLKPKNVFILFGANDMEGGLKCETFISRYKELIKAIKNISPDSNIYVQSILPVTAKVEIKKPNLSNKKIKEFNTALMAMAEENSCSYINIASVLDNSEKELHEPDGIHFKKQFYGLWLQYVNDNIK